MNCPECFKLNLHFKLILLPGLYVCENDVCTFCEAVDLSFKACDSNCSNVEILAKKSDNENLSISDKIDNGKFYDKENIESNVINISKPITSEVIIYNENLNNNSVDSFELNNNNTQIIPAKNSDYLSRIFEELFDSVIKNPEVNICIKNNDLSDHYKELNNISNSVAIKSKRLSKTNSKMKILDEATAEKLSKKFWETNNKMFNWIRMPYFLKTHSKIVRILLLHLEAFNFKETTLFGELKHEYSVMETFANQYRIDRVKPLCYRFLNKLYNIVDTIPNKNLIGKEMDERVLCLFNRIFDKYDGKMTLKFDYTTTTLCSFCNDNTKSDCTSYYVTLERNKTNIKTNTNHLCYTVNCLKCKNKSLKTIKFRNVPQFVVFHCPKGVKENIECYDNLICNSNNEKLSVVAVVESGSKYPFIELPENDMSHEIYDISAPTMDTRHRPSYCVHFRNSDGWYSMNGYKGYLCSPTSDLVVNSLSDVRFIIFGVVSDPRKYRQQFSLQDFITDHEKYTRENLNNCFEKWTLRSQQKEICTDLKTKKNKIRTKRKHDKDESENLQSAVKKFRKSKNKKINENDRKSGQNILVNTLCQDSHSPSYQSSNTSPLSSFRNEDISFSSGGLKNYKPKLTSVSSSDLINKEHQSNLKNLEISLDDLITRKRKKLLENT